MNRNVQWLLPSWGASVHMLLKLFPVYCAFVTRPSAKCKCNRPWMFQYWCSSMPCSSWAPIYIGCGFTEVVWHIPVWLFVMPLIRIAVVLFLSDAFHCLAGVNALCGQLFFLKLEDSLSCCLASNAHQFLTRLLLNSLWNLKQMSSHSVQGDVQSCHDLNSLLLKKL